MQQFSDVLPHWHGEKHVGSLRQQLSKTEQFAAAAEIFRQLGDPTRIRIYWLLCHREECVVNLAALLNVSSPAVVHHLRSMSACGLLASRRDGKEVYYRVEKKEENLLLHRAMEQIMEIACPEKTENIGETADEAVRAVHAYVMDHLSERLTIEELSKRFLMNPTSLKTAFKRIYGTSLAAHMKIHRMERAAAALLAGTESVGAIARAVGYESQSRFTAAFRETYGMLPTEYRRQHPPLSESSCCAAGKASDLPAESSERCGAEGGL